MKTQKGRALGIDIGSVSIAAVLLDQNRAVVYRDYRYHNGNIHAVLSDMLKKLPVEILCCFGVVSEKGREFFTAGIEANEQVALIAGVRQTVPNVRAIVSIGGETFGIVLFDEKGQYKKYINNSACAAGTGSFLDQQASRLGLRNSAELSERAAEYQNAPPKTATRCAVFAKTDLVHIQQQGYRREELMAAALHSVRDNYLSKVAHINKIGDHITFQGATAKNHALVRAFEHKLQKPIYVSKYCHLTGALGVCLKMADANLVLDSGFRKNLHLEEVVVDEYACTYCNNHCKIKSIELEGETLGWGYLCGREEKDTGYRKKERHGFDLLRKQRTVFNIPDKNTLAAEYHKASLFQEFQQGGIRAVIRSPGFSLSRLINRIQFNALEMRNELFSSGIVSQNHKRNTNGSLSVGLPSTLAMLEYLPLWELFFKRLGFKTIVTSTDYSRIPAGKQISSADYCVPLVDFHGNMQELEKAADFIFFPQLFEAVSEKESKFYCYYSHYAVPIIKNNPAFDLGSRLISPVLNLHHADETISRIYRALPEEIKERTSYDLIEEAYRLAWDWFQERKGDLHRLFRS